MSRKEEGKPGGGPSDRTQPLLGGGWKEVGGGGVEMGTGGSARQRQRLFTRDGHHRKVNGSPEERHRSDGDAPPLPCQLPLAGAVTALSRNGGRGMKVEGKGTG